MKWYINLANLGVKKEMKQKMMEGLCNRWSGCTDMNF